MTGGQRDATDHVGHLWHTARVIAPAPTPLIASAAVPYEVRTGWAGPRALAAVRATTTGQQLGAEIVRLLDIVWPTLREQGVRTGHNVVVYYGSEGGALTIDAGVEAFTDFTERGEVKRISTPSGDVATTAHYGEYSDMAPAYAALERWCGDNGRRPAGVNWEVYGDWEDDPLKRRTDVYFLLEPAAGHRPRAEREARRQRSTGAGPAVRAGAGPGQAEAARPARHIILNSASCLPPTPAGPSGYAVSSRKIAIDCGIHSAARR